MSLFVAAFSAAAPSGSVGLMASAAGPLPKRMPICDSGSLSGKLRARTVTTVGLAAGEEVEAVLGESTAICGDAKSKVAELAALCWSATWTRKRMPRPAPGRSVTLMLVCDTATTLASGTEYESPEAP